MGTFILKSLCCWSSILQRRDICVSTSHWIIDKVSAICVYIKVVSFTPWWRFCDEGWRWNCSSDSSGLSGFFFFPHFVLKKWRHSLPKSQIVAMMRELRLVIDCRLIWFWGGVVLPVSKWALFAVIIVNLIFLF